MSYKGDVLGYLFKHEGDVVQVKDMADELNIGLDRVRHAINNLRSHGNGSGNSRSDATPLRNHIEVMVTGDVVRYTKEPYTTEPVPTAQPRGRRTVVTKARSVSNRKNTEGLMFELFGTAVDGSPLLRCEDGRIFKATEI